MSQQPDRGDDRRFQDASLPQQDADLEHDRAALERVLRETLENEAVESAGTGELTALQSVARKYASAELAPDPVVAELVRAILGPRLPVATHASGNWCQMTLEIATVLFEAPVSRQRLSRLWNSLLEATG
jgi:hypothetical protein